MKNQTDIIEQIRELAAHNEDIAAVWLYGSRSKGNAQPHSDYDIAVAFKNFQLNSLDKFLRPNELAIDWSASLGLPSDALSIVDINLAPTYLAYNIIETGAVLYSEGTSRVCREQDRIYSQFEHQHIEQRRHA
ncbi:MAG: nucleotidyltransferase domain-containing protein [Natronospirillum sp.]